MLENAGGLEVDLKLNTDSIKKDLKDLSSLSEEFGRELTTSLANAIVNGDKLSSVLKKLLVEFSGRAFSMAIAPLSNAMGGFFGSLFDGITANAKGNIFTNGRVTPFAQGGVVNSPTLFPLRGGTGLMGEAGPEAVLPLARGSDGKLGVQAANSGRPVNVVMNVTARDADSFLNSRSQISAMLARAAEHGTRNL